MSLGKTVDGKKMLIARKWLLEAKWIERFRQKTQSRTKIINATQGGLGLKNIVHTQVKEVEQKSILSKCAIWMSLFIIPAIEDAGT